MIAYRSDAVLSAAETVTQQLLRWQMAFARYESAFGSHKCMLVAESSAVDVLAISPSTVHRRQQALTKRDLQSADTLYLALLMLLE